GVGSAVPATGTGPGMIGVVPAGAGVPDAGALPTIAADAAALPGVAPVGGVVIVQGAELMQALTRIQLGNGSGIDAPAESNPDDSTPTAEDGGADTDNVLHRLKSSSLGAGMNALDR